MFLVRVTLALTPTWAIILNLRFFNNTLGMFRFAIVYPVWIFLPICLPEHFRCLVTVQSLWLNLQKLRCARREYCTCLWNRMLLILSFLTSFTGQSGEQTLWEMAGVRISVHRSGTFARAYQTLAESQWAVSRRRAVENIFQFGGVDSFIRRPVLRSGSKPQEILPPPRPIETHCYETYVLSKKQIQTLELRSAIPTTSFFSVVEPLNFLVQGSKLSADLDQQDSSMSEAIVSIETKFLAQKTLQPLVSLSSGAHLSTNFW